MTPAPRTVLIVTDTSEDRELYQRCLVCSGRHTYTFLEAATGAEGLILWRQQPDIVLLDYCLPDMDGLKFIASLAAAAQLRPVVMITGAGSESIAVQAIKLGAQDYLAKDQVTPERLQLTVDKAIKAIQQQRWIEQDRLNLRESERRFRQLAENIEMAFWVTELPNRRVSYVSPAYESLWGLSIQDIYDDYRAWTDLLHPDDQPRVEKAFEEKATQGQFDEEYRIILPDGTQRWIRDRCFPIQNSSGKTYRLTGIAADITEQKRAEQALQESESLLRLAMDSAHAGSWIWEIATGKVVWSPENYDLYGLDPAQGPPQYEDWSNALHPDDRDRANAEVARVVEHQLPEFRAEFRIVHPQRGIRWIQGIGCLELDKHGEPLRLSGINLDITERKRAETDRKRAETQREYILQREQEARAEAERANRIKDEFLAILSHELRSPLNPILGWSKLLQMRKLDEAKTAQALETIERNAKLQTQLIDDLLDIARILRGKLKLENIPVSLPAAIEAAIETVRTAAEVKSISIHTDLADIGQIVGDIGRIQQIVWNLLSNAIKFTPRNGRVEIQLTQVEDQAQLTVADTGKGISPDFLPHIFQSFRQEDASITRQHGGLGLGLAIVNYLVEAHGGTISVDSPGEGQGTVFTVRFPLIAQSANGQAAGSLAKAEAELVGIRVLAVDDSPDARDLLTTLLTQYRATVMIVATAAEVLANLETFQPDVLVCDIGMPDMDGYGLMESIRALPAEKGGQVPAIALTAYVRESDQQRTLDCGYQRHLAKPIDVDKLLQTISTLARAEG